MSKTDFSRSYSKGYAMVRAINLRQIEVFKAFIEHRTVSRAAEVLAISQPAASKLLMQLERENGLKLFDRAKGRLAPTAQGLRLYDEVDRIFAGVRQVESAIAVVRREDQGRLIIGVMPALAGEFIQRATMNFLKRNPNAFCSIQAIKSQWVAENVLTRKLDIGLVEARVDSTYIVTEPLLAHPLLCIMPIGHALAQQSVVRPKDLNDVPFISFSTGTYTTETITGLFERYNIKANVVLTANLSLTVCQFVAAGLGISLVHPLLVVGLEKRIVARPFEPATPFDFLLCFARDARNAHLIGEFVENTKVTATRVAEELKRTWT